MKSTNTTFLKNYEVSEYLITDVQLDISISKNNTTVTAKLKIKENPNHPKPSKPIRNSAKKKHKTSKNCSVAFKK